MDFILSVCDDTIMHMKFCHDFLGYIGVIALWLSECHWFFLFSIIDKQAIEGFFMKFIYGKSVMMHVKIHKDVIGC